MAAMDQGKLDAMCNAIQSQESNYESEMTNATRDMKDTFDTNWVSNASKKLASEISEATNELATKIAQVFNDKNQAIATAVNNFNATEEESIAYSGFTFNVPNTTITVNDKLPNGKVGVAEGADIGSIRNPMQTMVTGVNEKLGAIESAVSSSDAFDSAEVQALSSSINSIKSAFNGKMEELQQSLDTRMSGEISQREELDRVNVQNLGGN